MSDDQNTTTPTSDIQDDSTQTTSTGSDATAQSAATSAPTSQSENDALEAEITAVFAQLNSDLEAEQTARKQLMADFENFRRRMEAEKAKFGAIANMQLIVQLLEIVDDVQLSMSDPEVNTGRSGEVMQIVNDKIVASLNSVGVDKVEIKVGDKFDPETMEALTTIPASDPAQANTISTVVSSAFNYRGDGSLLKHAKVIVFKA